jgi:hypothetical protein
MLWRWVYRLGYGLMALGAFMVLVAYGATS